MIKLSKSKLGCSLSFIYLGLCFYLLATQGLFGESFIVVFLGLPWNLLLIFLDKFSPKEGTALFHLYLYAEFLGPIILNAFILYWLGVSIDKARSGNRS